MSHPARNRAETELSRQETKGFLRQYYKVLAAVEKNGRLRKGEVGVITDEESGIELRLRHPDRSRKLGRGALRAMAGRPFTSFLKATVEIVPPVQDEPVTLSVFGFEVCKAQVEVPQYSGTMDVDAALEIFKSLDPQKAITRKTSALEFTALSRLEGADAAEASKVLRTLIESDQGLPPRIVHNNESQRAMAEMAREEVPPLVSVRRNDFGGGRESYDGRVIIHNPNFGTPHRIIDFMVPTDGKGTGKFYIQDNSRHYHGAMPAERRQIVSILKETLTPEAQAPDMNEEQGKLPPEDVVEVLPNLFVPGSRFDAETGTKYNYGEYEDNKVFDWHDPFSNHPGKLMVRKEELFYTIMFSGAHGTMGISLPFDLALARDPEQLNLYIYQLPLGLQEGVAREKLLASLYSHLRRIGEGKIVP